MMPFYDTFNKGIHQKHSNNRESLKRDEKVKRVDFIK